MSPNDDELLRLATVVDRQRQEMDDLRAEMAAKTVVVTATGMLMERLACSAAEAVAQLTRLAEATGVPVTEMAATVVGADPPRQPGASPPRPAGADSPRPAGASPPRQPGASPPRPAGADSPRQAGGSPPGQAGADSPSAAGADSPSAAVVFPLPPPSPGGVAGAVAADGAELAATLAGQLASYGAVTVVIWLLTPGGALGLLGESGLGEAEAARWRHIPPQMDCVAQRVAHGDPDQWWDLAPDRPPRAGEPRPGVARTGEPRAGEPRPGVARTGEPWPGVPRAGVLRAGPAGSGGAVLGLRERSGELIGVLELSWPPGGALPGDVREPVTALAAGTARVLGARLAHGDLTAAQPRHALFELLDQVAGSALVIRAVRDARGAVTDFAIEHLSPGYLDPAGRPASDLAGLTLLEAYPLTTAGHGLFARAMRVLEDGQPQYVPGPLAELVPLADFRAVRFFDGVIFTWRAYGEAGGLTDLLDHIQRLGRLGGWEENLTNGTVRWTDPVFEIFGLTSSAGEAIPLADLHSYVIAADKPVVRRFSLDLPAGPDAMSTTFRIVRPDDSSVRQVRVFAEPVTDATGTVVALRGAFQDVSAHYLTQVALDVTRGQLADTEQRAEEEHRLALRLQQAILPPEAHPVEAVGMDVAVRYRPAGRGHLVGGDWYDTLVLPGKDVLLVVGDVAGHGIEAVTGMVAARNALRGLAVTGAGPAELLRLLNVTLCHLVSSVIGTVVCGIYDADSGLLRWARAGHLPPMLIRDGNAETLPLPGGVLLGMDPDAEYEEVTLPLRPADTLVFFTDGLIERRGESIGDALGTFTAAANDAPGPVETAAACADRLLASAISDTDDDACLVTVRIL